VPGAAFFEQGMSVRYPVFFEKMITRCIANMKAVLPMEGDTNLSGIEYFGSLTKNAIAPDNYDRITHANIICLSNDINAVFCNRVSILVFKRRKPGMISPHNHGSLRKKTNQINSS